MLRKDAETAIIAKLEEIAAIYRAYNPDGKYLEMTIHTEENEPVYLHVANDYWNHLEAPLYRSQKGEEIYDFI